TSSSFRNIFQRFCLILILVMTAFGATSRGAWVESTIVRPDRKTGRLVRSAVVEPSQPTHSAEAADLTPIIERVALEQGIEAPLVHSVIRAESNYNPAAVSTKGALGVMQLIPATARRFGVNDAFDPEQNIEGGARYLKFLLDYYHGDYPKAIAAYN